MITIVTGDDMAIVVPLSKNGVITPISESAVVSAAIVSADHSTVLAGPVACSSNGLGADWANMIVSAEFVDTDTSAITKFKPALLEIQVDDGGKLTWFVDVRILKGQIG